MTIIGNTAFNDRNLRGCVNWRHPFLFCTYSFAVVVRISHSRHDMAYREQTAPLLAVFFAARRAHFIGVFARVVLHEGDAAADGGSRSVHVVYDRHDDFV